MGGVREANLRCCPACRNRNVYRPWKAFEDIAPVQSRPQMLTLHARYEKRQLELLRELAVEGAFRITGLCPWITNLLRLVVA